MLGSATGCPVLPLGLTWAPKEGNWHVMSRTGPGWGWGESQQQKARGGHSLPMGLRKESPRTGASPKVKEVQRRTLIDGNILGAHRRTYKKVSFHICLDQRTSASLWRYLFKKDPPIP